MSTEKIECGGCAPPVHATTPNDAARPVYQRRCTLHAYCDWVAISFAEYEEAASHEGQYAYRILYPATDYDKLREEVERLREDRDSWRDQASDRVADWVSCYEREKAAIARAEAAEARANRCKAVLFELESVLLKGSLSGYDDGNNRTYETTEHCAAMLRAALNAQDPQ